MMKVGIKREKNIKELFMEESIQVRYLWNSSYKDDLVCELTEFMDKYVKHKVEYMFTYLYNDLGVFSSKNILQIAFRYPGATRGSIILKRIDAKKFEIVGINFHTDCCFSEKFGCYEEKLKDDIDKYIGRVLDFSNVTLVNNNFDNYWG